MTDIIGFEQFADEVRNAMELRYPESSVEIRRVTKNNGVIYTGITVSSEEEKVYPTMYLEPFYEEVGESGLTDELIDRMCSVYESRRVGNAISLEHLLNYAEVKDKLRCKLINYAANSERLKAVPHRRFMDLAIVPYCLVTDCELGRCIPGEASFMVTSGNLSAWGVSEEQVLDDSIANTLREEHPSITGMYDMLMSLNPGLVQNTGDEIKDCPMYVMTTDGSNGAVSMIYEDRLKEFCNTINSDIYVIPSSINEVILVPYEEDTSEMMLNDMIKEINLTQLEPVDVLSDHVYYFERNSGYAQVVKKAS